MKKQTKLVPELRFPEFVGEWKINKIGNIATLMQGIQVGVDKQRDFMFKGSVRFIRIIDYTKELSNEIRYIKHPGERFLVGKNDLVMIRYGDAGKVVKDIEGAIANNMFKIILDDEANKLFFYYYLTREQAYNYFVRSSSSTTMPAVTFKVVENYKVKLPPLSEQTKIANFLSTVDAKLKQTIQQIDLLEKYKQGVMQELFPQKGEANPKLRFKGDDGKSFGDWEKRKLGEVCKMYQPQTISQEEMIEDGCYPVFGANGIIGRYDKYNHERRQLTITCRGATCGAVNITKPFSWITGNAMVIKPLTQVLDVRIVELFFRNSLNLTKVITGAAQPQITRKSLFPIKISYPKSQREQAKIVNSLSSLEKKIKQTQQYFDFLTEWKKGLLQKMLV